MIHFVEDFDLAGLEDAGPLPSADEVRGTIHRIRTYNKSISEQVSARRREVFRVWMRKEYKVLGYRSFEAFLPKINIEHNQAIGMVSRTKMERTLDDHFTVKLGLNDSALHTLTYRVEKGHAIDVVQYVIDHHPKTTSKLLLEAAHILGVYNPPKPKKTDVTLPVTKKTEFQSFEKNSPSFKAYRDAVEAYGEDATARALQAFVSLKNSKP